MTLDVAADPFFRREGNDIHADLPVSMTEALLGAEKSLPTLKGEVELTVRSCKAPPHRQRAVTPTLLRPQVPAGTQPGDKLLLRGRGIEEKRSGKPGDQFVHVHVQLPK